MRGTAVLALVLVAPAMFAQNGVRFGDCAGTPQELLSRLEKRYAAGGSVGLELEAVPDPPRGLDFVHRVTRVHPRSPAEVAGFLAGDLIWAVDGVRTVRSEESLRRFFLLNEGMEAGREYRYTVLRDGEELTLAVVAEPRSPANVRVWITNYVRMNGCTEARLLVEAEPEG